MCLLVVSIDLPKFAPKGIFLLMSEDKTIETWQRLKDCSTFSLKSIPLRHLNWKFSQSPQAES